MRGTTVPIKYSKGQGRGVASVGHLIKVMHVKRLLTSGPAVDDDHV